MRLRELGLNSLGSAARIQLKPQTPPKGHFWLCMVILLQATETSVSYIYWYSMGTMETWPPWL